MGVLMDPNPIGKIPMWPFEIKECFPTIFFEIPLDWTIAKEFWRKLNINSNFIVLLPVVFPRCFQMSLKSCRIPFHCFVSPVSKYFGASKAGGEHSHVRKITAGRERKGERESGAGG
jgi:hypothetical protein